MRTDHIVRERIEFVEYYHVPSGSKNVYMGNQFNVEVLGLGTSKLEMQGGRVLYLHDVLNALKILRNFFSILSLPKLGFSFQFWGNKLDIFHKTIFYGFGYLSNDFMVLDIVNNPCYDSSFSLLAFVDNAHDDSVKWHARFDHIGHDRMVKLAREGLLSSLAKVNLPTCEHCLAGKTTRKPFGKVTRAYVPLQLIHYNICGEMNVRAMHGPRGKKNIFIRCHNHSKGYVFISKQSEKGIIEIGSRDVDFLEEDFPSRGEVSKKVELYELQDPNICISVRLIKTDKLIPQPHVDSGSDLHSRSPHIESSQDIQPHISKRGKVPHRHFETEAGNDKELIAASKRWLSSSFKMKNMGEADYVLEVKIFRDRSKRLLGLSQKGYLENVLNNSRCTNSNPWTPMLLKVT
ncbi:hypothetical protein RJ640_017934 [Escallonia rubra]|uniref:GAG-pre-integrase domain-containing protein n=1 Tax=Escallonia rubra TaxID=112253 RepID=A0AA88U5P5_9ASTE|nr:hypothetical protein RJ640_017934 [Escallonia rubra]